MIETAAIASYLATRRKIASAAAHPDSGFEPSRREMSEGLCKQVVIDGDTWTYATAAGGYLFTSPDRGASVFLPNDPARHESFMPGELVSWLRAGGGHERLNEFVLENLLLRAEIDGEVDRAPGQRGCWRLKQA